MVRFEKYQKCPEDLRRISDSLALKNPIPTAFLRFGLSDGFGCFNLARGDREKCGLPTYMYAVWSCLECFKIEVFMQQMCVLETKRFRSVVMRLLKWFLRCNYHIN